MSGIYIPGMKMPVCCGACPIIDDETLECRVGGSRDRNAYDGRYGDCPLVDMGDVLEEMKRRLIAHED